MVEYEPDADLRDTEQVPLLEEGGIDAFISREVLPYTPDAPATGGDFWVLWPSVSRTSSEQASMRATCARFGPSTGLFQFAPRCVAN